MTPAVNRTMPWNVFLSPEKSGNKLPELDYMQPISTGEMLVRDTAEMRDIDELFGAVYV